ncbi:MAG: hypothetical protein IJZ68_07140 [Bacteroidaceae bacterium]|nr:hypothetical protein [Bacteroidaceae bacterium]
MKTMTLRPYTVGSRVFDERPVTVTDPGYDAGTWCTLTGIKVQPGKYDCVAWRGRDQWKDDTGKRRSCTRTMICGIYLEGNKPNPEEWGNMPIIGTIGVDAGLAGFFQDKPDYDRDAWFEMCDKLLNKSWMITEEGFFTESGYGDGSYNVHGVKNEAGLYTALEIRF